MSSIAVPLAQRTVDSYQAGAIIESGVARTNATEEHHKVTIAGEELQMDDDENDKFVEKGSDAPHYVRAPSPELKRLEVNYNLFLYCVPLFALWVAHPVWNTTKDFPIGVFAVAGVLMALVLLTSLLFSSRYYSNNGQYETVWAHFHTGNCFQNLATRFLNHRFHDVLPDLFAVAYSVGFFFVYVLAMFIRALVAQQNRLYVPATYAQFLTHSYTCAVGGFTAAMCAVAVSAGVNLTEYGEDVALRTRKKALLNRGGSCCSTDGEIEDETLSSDENERGVIELESNTVNKPRRILKRIRSHVGERRYDFLRENDVSKERIIHIVNFERRTILKQRPPKAMSWFAIFCVACVTLVVVLHPLARDMGMYTRDVYEVRDEFKTYDDACLACKGDGDLSILAHPRANLTQEDLLETIRFEKPNATLVWIGLILEANGTLVWSDGAAFNDTVDEYPEYLNATAASATTTTGLCHAIHKTTGMWQTRNCSDSAKVAFACQYGPAFSSLVPSYAMSAMAGLLVVMPACLIVSLIWVKVTRLYLRNEMYMRSLSMRHLSYAMKLKSAQEVDDWLMLRRFYTTFAMKHNFQLASPAFASAFLSVLLFSVYSMVAVIMEPDGFKYRIGNFLAIGLAVYSAGVMLLITGHALKIYMEQKAHHELLDLQKTEILNAPERDQEMLESVNHALHYISTYDVHPTVLGVPITPTTLNVMKGYLLAAGTVFITQIVKGEASE